MTTSLPFSQQFSHPLDLHQPSWLYEESDSLLSEESGKDLKKMKDDLNQQLNLKDLKIEVEPFKLDFHKFLTSNPSFKPLDLELPKLKREVDLSSIIVIENHDTILIARPLKEFFSHIWNFKLPSFELVARVIKTLALSIFRWHLCDHVLLEQRNDLLNEKKIISQFSHNVSEMKAADFELAYPYLLESAYKLNLHDAKLEERDFDYDECTPDTLRAYFEKCYVIQITSKKTGNTINDFFQSQELVLEKST